MRGKDADAFPTASDLRDLRRRYSMTNHESYRLVYSRLSKQLRDFARSNPTLTSFAFEVPPFLLGRPLFDRAHAVRYVYEKAVRHGYTVRQTGDGATLVLDWSPLPVPRKPLEVRRRQAEASAERDRRLDLRTRKEKASTRNGAAATVVQDAVDARDAAEALNRHLDDLLTRFRK